MGSDPFGLDVPDAGGPSRPVSQVGEIDEIVLDDERDARTPPITIII